MITFHEKRVNFRKSLQEKDFLLAPGIYDALSAKIAERAGIKCLAMGGYAISSSRLGAPDIGLLTLTEMTLALKQICNAVDIPVIADADTGYGDLLNVRRTIQEYEAAGASCIFLEDQVWPKRCGHMEGKKVIPAEEHARKIRMACESRLDKSTLIMARTDAYSVNGFNDAIYRAKLYRDSGAEAIFIEALGTRDELEKAAKELEGSGVFLFANMIEGGKTPILSAHELKALGYAGVFWSCLSLYLVSHALRSGFCSLVKNGSSSELEGRYDDFSTFNEFVGLKELRCIEAGCQTLQSGGADRES